ncbi:unnamed protein product [Boreogadus saida]
MGPPPCARITCYLVALTFAQVVTGQDTKTGGEPTQKPRPTTFSHLPNAIANAVPACCICVDMHSRPAGVFQHRFLKARAVMMWVHREEQRLKTTP